MSQRTLTASDRQALIKLASSLPKGDPTRRAVLAGLVNKTATSGVFSIRAGQIAERQLRRDIPEFAAGNVLLKLSPGKRPYLLLSGSTNSIPVGPDSEEYEQEQISFYDYFSAQVSASLEKIGIFGEIQDMTPQGDIFVITKIQ